MSTRHLLLAAAVAVAALAAPAPAQDTIPLRPLWGRLKSIRVVVAGDSLDFLFDTGGSVTVVAREVAERLGCTPTGRHLGYRMTGERLAGPFCPGVALRVGPVAVRADAGVADMAAMLGRPDPGVHGTISLQSFAGRAVTLDLAGNRLVVETPRSLAARTRAMTPVPMRVATGLHGGEVTPFLGVPAGPAPDAPTLWLELDTGHQAATFLAPHAARMLGAPDGAERADVAMSLGTGRVVVPARVKDVIHDGVLSAAFIARAVYTLDLAHERAWVGPVAAVPALADGGAPVQPALDPTGRYEVVPIVQGKPEPGVLVVTRQGGALAGEFREVGSDLPVPVRDVAMDGARLRFTLLFGTPTPFELTFDGLAGRGRWADGAQHGGEASAVKRS